MVDTFKNIIWNLIEFYIKIVKNMIYKLITDV
jgi:hypothetical protein